MEPLRGDERDLATGQVFRITSYGGYALLILALILGFALGRMTLHQPVRFPSLPITEGATLAKPGPWGKLELIPMTIAAPDEILPVKGLEASTTQWMFKGHTVERLTQFLSSIELPKPLQDQLLNPSTLNVTTNGVAVRPSNETLLALPANARLAIYKMLCRDRDNERHFGLIQAESLEQYFQGSGVSESTVALLKQLSCKSNKHFIFSGWSCLLSAIPSHEEKVRLMKAISRQKTLLVKLHAAPDSDINSLASYWGKAVWNTDVKAMLESLKRLPNGARVDIIELLPPFPSSLLYTFPVPQNPMNGPRIRRDCHWTAFNFFRDPPDPRYGDSDYIIQMLQTDHFPIQADPRFGDIVLFMRPDDSELVHTAVFLADDVVFTKNGETAIYPWMFSTIPDLLEQYSFLESPGHKLEVRYYRNKYY